MLTKAVVLRKSSSVYQAKIINLKMYIWCKFVTDYNTKMFFRSYIIQENLSDHKKVQIITPAFQTLGARWGYCTKQDFSGSQVTCIIPCSSLSYNSLSQSENHTAETHRKWVCSCHMETLVVGNKFEWHLCVCTTDYTQLHILHTGFSFVSVE